MWKKHSQFTFKCTTIYLDLRRWYFHQRSSRHGIVWVPGCGWKTMQRSWGIFQHFLSSRSAVRWHLWILYSLIKFNLITGWLVPAAAPSHAPCPHWPLSTVLTGHGTPPHYRCLCCHPSMLNDLLFGWPLFTPNINWRKSPTHLT